MNCGGKSRGVVCAIVVSMLWGLFCAIPAAATITALGDIVPLYDASDPWSIPGDLRIGIAADANMVVSAGSRVQSNRGLIGLSSDEFDISEVTVTGPGSLWQNESELAVGAIGRGTLFIANGGRVTSPFSSVALGADSGGMVQVRGSGSLWDSDVLHIGVAGLSTVYIEEGGHVTSRSAVLGVEPTGTGVVLISGPDSVWENLRDPDSGLGGDLYMNGYLAISTGSRVITDTARVEGEVGVYSTGSLWENRSTLEIGRTRVGSLSVNSGAMVTTREAVVAAEPGSEGVVTVVGPASTLEVVEELTLGSRGDASMTVSGGGRVRDADAYVAAEFGSSGSVVVTGADSIWDNVNDLSIGHRGNGQLLISDGGHVTNADATLGTVAGSTGSATVTGANSLWAHGVWLTVGGDGDGALLVSDSGRMTSVLGTLASGSASTGLARVTGSGSQWLNAGDLCVAEGGTGSLLVSNGGYVEIGRGEAALLDGSMAHIAVSGHDSALSYTTALSLGHAGDVNMVVADGGRVYAYDASLALEPGGTAVLSITGADSSWSTPGELRIAESGQASVLIADGATLENRNGTIAVDPDGIGAVTVTGSGSLWENTDQLIVGGGGDATLLISDGGRVTNAGHAWLANGPGSTAVVTVTGTGSVWTSADDTYVGGTWDGPWGTATLAIRDGGLVVADDMQVWGTGAIEGDGTLRARSVMNRGTIRPGSSIGTLTIEGDLTFDMGSTLEVEVDNDGAGDKLAVVGDVSIVGGAVRAIAIETLTGSHQYLIVEANNVSGQFEALDTALLDSFVLLEAVGLDYEPGSVLLTVTQTPFDDPNVVRTGNQGSLGSALQQIAEGGGNDITTALQQLETGDEVRRAYDQLSGQTTPSLAPVTVAGATRHVGMISGRIRNPAGGFSRDMGLAEPSAALPSGTDTVGVDTGRSLFALGNGTAVFGDRPWGVWGKGYGLYGDRESESGVPGYQYTVYGAGFGLDYRFTEQLLLGLTGGYSDGDINYSGSRDSSDVSATHGGLYGGYETSRWYLDSILTYADLDYETRRYVDVVGERLEGDPSGDMFTGYLEAGLNRWRSERTLIQPLAAFQFSSLHIDGFTETGGDSALTFDDERYESYKGSLGVKLTRRLFERAGGSRADLELRGRWVHEFGDTKATFDAGFASDPGVTFRVSDEDISRDSAVLGAGLDTWFTRQTRLFLDYGTELNADNTVHLVSAGLEHRW